MKGPERTGYGGLPGGVWALGFVSLCMDLSSEMIHSLLPVFLISTLGASAAALGLLEGVAEAAVLVARMGSGWLSDALGRRKTLAILGYGLAALTKPLFPLAGSYAMVFAARVLDRIGKGIRGAPRDALVADLTPPERRGASYGLRQSLDTVGAVGGPLLAVAVMLASGGAFRLVFWAAVPSAFLSVAVLMRFVSEPDGPAAPIRRPSVDWQSLGSFPPRFWAIVGIGSVFTLARFSEAFLVLRGRDLGLPLDYLPLVMAGMSAAYALSAYPAGLLSDSIDRRLVLAAGAAVLIAADLVLARARGLGGLGLGIALWGVHMGLSQGLFAALVADAAPTDRRGTAFGLFNLASGGVLLAASLLAGELWQHMGAPATFYAGTGFAVLALGGLAIDLRSRPPR